MTEKRKEAPPAKRRGRGPDKKPRKKRRQADYLALLEKAIRQVEKERGEKLWHRVVQQAWNDTKLMTHILKKLLPDMKQSEIQMNIDTHDDWVRRLEVDDEYMSGINEDTQREADSKPPETTEKKLSVVR